MAERYLSRRRTLRRAGRFVTLAVIALAVAQSSWSISEADKFYDQIKIFNEVLSEVQFKYVEEDKVQTEALVRSAIQGMLKDLDPHSAYLPPKEYNDFREDTRGMFGGLGITIDIPEDGWLTVVSPLPDTPAFREGILAGDKIVKIDGESTEGIDIREAVRQLRGEIGTQVTITIFRPSDRSTVDHTIIRDMIKIPNVYVYTIDDRFGYIRLIEFKQTASADLDQALDLLDEKDIEGLILDLRFNSGGLLDMAVEVSDKFLPKNKRVVSIRGRNGDNERPYLSRNKARSRLPLVVLVNQASASASEIVAGAMKDWGRGILVGPAGRRTYGKGSVQTVIPLSDQSALKITTAKYFTPLGRSIQDEKGIEPDIQVDIDENYQRQMLSLGKLAKLPKTIATVEQIWPPTLEEAQLAEESVDSATPEQAPGEIEDKESESDSEAEDKNPEIYDKELAKAVEILESHVIWASADELFK